MFRVSDDEYNNYIKYSPIWKQKVKDRLEIDKHRCQMCGTWGQNWNRLEVHHMNYLVPLGEEDTYKSLVCLCESCHSAVHNMLYRVTAPDGTRGWREATPATTKMRPDNPHLRNIRMNY